MKTKTLKKTIHIILFSVLIFVSIIITNNTIKNIKNLYGSERATNNAVTCFADLIY